MVARNSEMLKELVIEALDAIKGVEIIALNVIGLTDITDFMVIATGNSNRQVKALSENVVVDAKAAGYVVNSVEGEDSAEWILIDLGDVVCHIMLPYVREFYELERLWSISQK